MAGVLENAPRARVERDTVCVHEVRQSGQQWQGILPAIAGYASGERKVKAGSDLYSVGERCDAIFVVISGWVAVYDLLQDGRRQILQFVLPGALLRFNPDSGAAAMFGAEALTDVTVCTMCHASLVALLKDHPEVGMRFAELIARDRNLSFDHLTSIGRRSARERVARLLLELFVRYRAQWPGRLHLPEEMQLPLTQEHIADATGLTNVHVNRVLSELRDKGIVLFHYRKLVILDPDRLVEVAAIDPHLALGWMQREVFGEEGPAVSSEIEVAESG
jgi:CRP/FNR family transcriptional regulator